jgi:hypothetical protein
MLHDRPWLDEERIELLQGDPLERAGIVDE